MDKKSIIEKIREKILEIRNTEYRFTECGECRDRIAALWEGFCQRTEEANLSDADMRAFVGILVYLTQKYYQALPQKDCNSEFDENTSIEEVKANLNAMSYMCESARLMFVQSVLLSVITHDREHILEMLENIKEKLAAVQEEEICEQIAEAQTKDPWIFEVGARVSTIRKFEELMGEYPEITEVLGKSEDARGKFEN